MQQGEHGGSSHHDAHLVLCFHTTGDPSASCPTGKSDYLTPNCSSSCLEPSQEPQRAVVSQPHCIPPWRTRKRIFFLAGSLQERLGLGDTGWKPPMLGTEVWPGFTHITEQTSTWSSPGLQVREEGETRVPCSSTRGASRAQPLQHLHCLTGLPMQITTGS